jgi:hypothetical protein
VNSQEKRRIARSREPVKVGGVNHHGPICECSWCSAPSAPVKYAKLRK